MIDKALLIWSSSAQSHVGMVRSVNEDAYLDLPELGLWVVADGMGGHEAGDVASNMIISELRHIDEPRDLTSFIEDAKQRLLSVNQELRTLARQNYSNRTVGSTVAVLLAFGEQYALLWAGDSRIYQSRRGTFSQLTRDHNVREEYRETMLLQSQALTNLPRSNALTRAVGAHDSLELDVAIDALEDGDTFILCSDGLYKEVNEQEMTRVITHRDDTTDADRFLNLALERGARDNVTVVVVRIRNAFTSQR